MQYYIFSVCASSKCRISHNENLMNSFMEESTDQLL